jgi:zinc transporter, ZIP family
MSFAETVLLGALAGFTIYLGLPVGRLELLSARARVALAMFSVGILVFLLVDVLAHGFEISEEAVTAFHDGKGSFGHAAALALLLVGGFAWAAPAWASSSAACDPGPQPIRRSPAAPPTL